MSLQIKQSISTNFHPIYLERLEIGLELWEVDQLIHQVIRSYCSLALLKDVHVSPHL